MTDAPELLPCPMCGDARAPSLRGNGLPYLPPFHVLCRGPVMWAGIPPVSDDPDNDINQNGCALRTADFTTPEQAIAAWNIRADLSDASIMQERCAAVAEAAGSEPATDDDSHDRIWDGACLSVATAIRALPAITPADRLAAALKVPEIARMVSAAVVIYDTENMDGADDAYLIWSEFATALAALTPNEVK